MTGHLRSYGLIPDICVVVHISATIYSVIFLSRIISREEQPLVPKSPKLVIKLIALSLWQDWVRWPPFTQMPSSSYPFLLPPWLTLLYRLQTFSISFLSLSKSLPSPISFGYPLQLFNLPEYQTVLSIHPQSAHWVAQQPMPLGICSRPSRVTQVIAQSGRTSSPSIQSAHSL